MKFHKFGRIAAATAVSLGLAFGIAACGTTNTVDFVYVTSSKVPTGQINVYAVDYQSGALTQIPDSPYPLGGRNPVADVVSPNNKFLYVLSHDDNTVLVLAIGHDGKIYPQHTYNTPGSFPSAMAINATGTFLYVVDTYQPGFSTANPGPGALVVFPVNQNDGSLGSPVVNPASGQPYFPIGTDATAVPQSVTALANGNFVFAVYREPGQGFIHTFQVGSDGTLTTVNAAVPVGISPNASAADPTSRFLYVTDAAANQMIGFVILSNGTLTPMQAPFKTDIYPDSVVVDPRGRFIYVANYIASNVTAYTIDQSTGNATATATGTYGTDTGPTCVIIEPALGKYIYTSNFLGNSVTGIQLNPNDGTMVGVQNSPFPASQQPTCAAAAAHGNHRIQEVNPK